jgi:hypothetical protein
MNIFRATPKTELQLQYLVDGDTTSGMVVIDPQESINMLGIKIHESATIVLKGIDSKDLILFKVRNYLGLIHISAILPCLIRSRLTLTVTMQMLCDL